jgi:hypothetical protein
MRNSILIIVVRLLLVFVFSKYIKSQTYVKENVLLGLNSFNWDFDGDISGYEKENELI